jgi:hypothetical protein
VIERGSVTVRTPAPALVRTFDTVSRAAYGRLAPTARVATDTTSEACAYDEGLAGRRRSSVKRRHAADGPPTSARPRGRSR